MSTKSQLAQNHIAVPLGLGVSGDFTDEGNALLNVGLEDKKGILSQIPEFSKQSLASKNNFRPKIIINDGYNG
jgi:hypothetical protein